ncbi:MAG: sigma-70 family RNA polymerase sigma factor [Myxococcales bacterium]
MGSEALADEELVRHIGARDTGHAAAARAAEAELCARYATRIRLYGLKHLRERGLAEDLVQLVLLRVLEAARRGSIEQHDKLERFVLGTCRLTAQRMRARAQREQPGLLSDDDAGYARGHAGFAGGNLPEELVVKPFAMLDTAALMRCLAALELRARQVVMLSFQEERSAEEIATTLTLSAGNVRVLRHRALHALRQCLDGGTAFGPPSRAPRENA